MKDAGCVQILRKEMKKMPNLKKALDHNLRGGKVIDINSMLDDIEGKLRANIKQDIEVFTTEDEVRAETYNDEVCCRIAIELLENLGYIDSEECAAILEKAAGIRIAMLDEMVKEINK